MAIQQHSKAPTQTGANAFSQDRETQESGSTEIGKSVAGKSVAEKSEDRKLNHNQELFCREYIRGENQGNATRAYLAAYPGSTYETGKTEGTKHLAKPHIQKRLHELLEENGLTAATADQALLYTMLQVEDLPSKMRAVSEFNKLMGRYAPEKVDPTIADPMRALMELVLDKADAQNRSQRLPEPRNEIEPPTDAS